MLDETIDNTPTEKIESANTSESTPKTPESIEVEKDESAAVTEEITAQEEGVEKEESVAVPEEITAQEEGVEKGEGSAVTEEVTAQKEGVEKEEEVLEERPVVAAVDAKSKEQETEKTDYSTLSLEDLVKELQKLVKKEEVHHIKNEVEIIKKSFNQKFGTLLTEKKEAFLEDGGNEIDFQFRLPVKAQYNDLLFEYKVKREKHYKHQKEEQKENLSKRLVLIDELKSLIDNAEPSTMYKQFKELEGKWKVIGKIPHANYNDVWRTFHHHIERFYDLLHLNNDFRDLDFKHNLDEKLKLVERAEALVEEVNVNKAFKELQVLHKLWKEEVGPVAKEFRDDVWNKFSDATKKIHDKRHEFEKEAESKYEENVVIKEQVILEIENLLPEKDIEAHSSWQQKIRELEALRKKFFKIGKVPRSKNEQIWDAFKKATADFNRKKNAFYKNVKKQQQDNLDKKRALVEKAESLKDSKDFDSVTPVMKQIQAEWKKIGHVPRKFSDEIWKQFKSACNHYFDSLHNIQDEANKDQIEVFNKKKEMLDGLKSQADDNDVLSLKVIQSYINDWKNLGSVPFNMRHIESKFNKTVDKLYEKLDLDKEEIALLRFKNTVDTYLEQKQYNKLDDEQLFVRRKIDEINKEIQQLETNISFISSATDDNPLIKNVRNNIDKYVDEMEIWKSKLNYLSQLEY